METKSNDTVDFYHVALGDFDKSLENLSKGIHNNGTEEEADQSYFVQSAGFFFWNNKNKLFKSEPQNDEDKVEPHGWLQQWTRKRHRQEDFLLASCRVNKQDVKYPDWQFDVKNSYPYIKDMMMKHMPSIVGKELETVSGLEAGSTFQVTKINPHGFDFEVNGYEFLNVHGDNCSYGAIAQSICDELIKNPEFEKEYNELLQKSLTEKDPIAIKYTSDEKIPLNEVWNIHVNPDKSMSLKKMDLPNAENVAEKGDVSNASGRIDPIAKANEIRAMKAERNGHVSAPYKPVQKSSIDSSKISYAKNIKNGYDR